MKHRLILAAALTVFVGFEMYASVIITTSTHDIFVFHGPIPELFIDRLNRLLPENDDRRLSIDEIAHIENELMQFQIPRNVTVQFVGADYLSIQIFRWLFLDQIKQEKQCPRCYLRFDKLVERFDKFLAQGGTNVSDDLVFWKNNSLYDYGTADVKVHPGCPNSVVEDFRDAPWQLTIGGCGESQAGSGRMYAVKGRSLFDYHAGFEKVADGLFQTTYAHMHLSPDNRLGFPELFNITDMAKLLLRPAPIRPSEPEPAMFVHNDCRHKRGKLIEEMSKLDPPVLVARYKCMRNKIKPNLTRPFEDVPCAERDKEYWFHNDCYEPTRDAGKTVLSSFHKFTFSLENTHSPDYFTEKRWQALFAGSVPIVWDNHNSLDSLPDSDAAIIVPHEGPVKHLAADVARKLVYFNENTTAYQQLFEWKKRGLKASFVRKLFLSTDFLVCRLCEYAAHHRKRT